jgi:hypothetical protein
MKGATMESRKIVKAWRVAWVNWMLLTLFFVGIPCFVHADITDILLKFHPYITAQEEYSNNIFLSPNATKLNDYITTVTPGLRFVDLKAGSHGIDLDVSGGYIHYAKNHDFSYWTAEGRLDIWYAVAPRLTFRVRDSLVRSDEAREQVYSGQYDAQGEYIGDTEPDQYLLSTTRGVQAIYLRNVVEPAIEYRFGRENLLSLLYRNNIYRNENPQFEDSVENTFNPRLAFWFDMRNGVSLDYEISLITYQGSPSLMGSPVSPDQWTNGATAHYTHRFNPKTSTFGEYYFEWQNFESPGVDYYIHNPSVGIEHKFSPTLTGLAQGGYFWQVPKVGSNTEGPTFDFRLTKRAAKTLYTFAVEGGFTEDYGTAENLGFAQYYLGYGTIQHNFTQRLGVALTGSMGRYKYISSEELIQAKDWIWTASAGPSYLLFRWLMISLEASYSGANSNVAGNDYTEFRGLFRVTAFSPGFGPSFVGQPGLRSQPTSR